jgi:transcriptional regulator with XRE-family HTH domain
MNTSTPTQLLREIKVLTGLSEVALAGRLQVSQPTVNRILNGNSECKSGTLLEIQKWHGALAEAKESA